MSNFMRNIVFLFLITPYSISDVAAAPLSCEEFTTIGYDASVLAAVYQQKHDLFDDDTAMSNFIYDYEQFAAEYKLYSFPANNEFPFDRSDPIFKKIVSGYKLTGEFPNLIDLINNNCGV